MTRISRRVVCASLVGFAVLVAPTAHAQETAFFESVDASGFPIVRLVITVPAGVRPVGFSSVRVLQDGVERSASIAPLGAVPADIALVIDSSGSVAGAPIAAAKTALLEFLHDLPAGSEVAVLSFGDEPSVLGPLGTPREKLAGEIAAIEGEGRTALRDAVVEAIAALGLGAHERKLIILLTDGHDTASRATVAEAVDALSSTSVQLYAIQLVGTELDPEALALMATAANGTVMLGPDHPAVSMALAEVASGLVTRYAVTFEAGSRGPSRIDVMLGDPEHARLSAELTIKTYSVDLTESGDASAVATVAIGSPTETIPGPGALEGRWAFGVGIVLLGLAMFLAFGVGLQPKAGSGRPLVSLAATPRAKPPGAVRRLVSIVEGSQERGSKRPRPRSVEAALDATGVAVRAREYLVGVTIVALLGLGAGVLSGSPMIGALLFVIALAVPRLMLARAATRRRLAFSDQLEGTLQLISGSLRSGYGLSRAIMTVAEEALSPTSDEFARVVVETRIGRDLTSSLRSVAERMKNVDFAWVADAIAIQEGTGGNVAQVLDAVGSTIRDRGQIRRQVHALSAEGRMSAVIMIALPFGVAGIISIRDPGYLAPLFTTSTGHVLLGIAVVLLVVGIVWIRRIVKIAF